MGNIAGILLNEIGSCVTGQTILGFLVLDADMGKVTIVAIHG
jgi:hypothetical protein